MSTCSLCALSTPDPPVTAADVDGTFCCQGCLEVSRALADHDTIDRESVRDRAQSAVGGQARDAAASGEPTAVDETAVPDDAAEAFLRVEGMHCHSCEAFVSLLGIDHPGVYTVETSYATELSRVVYDPDRLDREELPDLLSGYGYVARFPDDPAADGSGGDSLERLLVGGFFAMLVMPWYLFYLYPSYVGIETGILTVDTSSRIGFLLPMAIVGVFSTIVVFYTGKPVLRGAIVSLRTRRPNMDLLVAIAALSAYAYSTVALALGSTHLYYDVSVAVILAVSLGTYYEDRIKRRATGLLAELTVAGTDEARRLVDGDSEMVSIDELRAGDRLLVCPGERIPTDGTIVEGTAAIDESILTGESLPVTKSRGDDVVGGSIVTDSAIEIRVGPDAESTIDRLSSLLWRIQSGTPGTQRLVDALATVFVPLVLVLGITVATWQLLTSGSVSAAMLAGLTVLVVSCPCAMGLATPLAIASGLREALERGIVVANDAVFEAAPEIKTIVFDKTGTLTTGALTVESIHGDPAAVELAAAVETRSEHPAATAIREHTDPADGTVAGFERHPGRGVSATVDGDRVVVGTPDLVTEQCEPLPTELERAVESARARGSLPVAIGVGEAARAVVCCADRARPEWDATLSAFADREVVILTGDDESAAAAFREHPAVDRVFAGVPPDGKVETIERLAAAAPTAMVGDGTNDAPALAAADLGIALGGGTALASEAADAIVTTDDLRSVPDVFELASATNSRIRQNVGWALCYNAVAIPLAAIGAINPLFAAVAMATSSLLVVGNSSRPMLDDRTARSEIDGQREVNGPIDGQRDANGPIDDDAQTTPETETVSTTTPQSGGTA